MFHTSNGEPATRRRVFTRNGRMFQSEEESPQADLPDLDVRPLEHVVFQSAWRRGQEQDMKNGPSEDGPFELSGGGARPSR